MAQRELWIQIVADLGLNLDDPVCNVSAAQVRAISQKEARNMAYMDDRRKLPSVFRDKGVFLLPVSNGHYVIVHGKGYQDLEESTLVHKEFDTPFLLDQELLGPTRSEGSAAAYAWNTGLIAQVTETKSLFLGPGGRFGLDPFRFHVNGSPDIGQGGAQAEIDGFYYGRQAAFLMEFKAEPRTNFLVRQLYFPYRHYSGRASSYGWRRVVPFFVDFDLPSMTYRFFEFEFSDPADYESIRLKRATAYHLRARTRPLRDLLSPGPDPDSGGKTPQADSVERVLRIPFRIGAGNETAQLMARVEEFTTRQSSYYLRAAEALGLVSKRGGSYALTQLGDRFVHVDEIERSDLTARQIARIPAFHEILTHLAEGEGRQVTRPELGQILAKHDPRIHQSTIPRRVTTALSWLRWLQTSTGLVSVDALGTVRPATRLRA